MRIRLAALPIVLLALSACGGASGGSTPPSTAGTSPVGASTAAPNASPIDLSGLDACTLLDDATVEALTGETGFEADRTGAGHCFWAVPRPGLPQYVEIKVFARPGGLAGYTWTPGEGCTSADVGGAGAEARGGICTSPQTKVYLLAWDRGVAVQVLVNEPKTALTPDDLAATAKALLMQLG